MPMKICAEINRQAHPT